MTILTATLMTAKQKHRQFTETYQKNDDNDKKCTDQFSREPSINEGINPPTGLQTKRSNCNMLEHNIPTLKAGSITMKNFMMQEIFNISQKNKKYRTNRLQK